MYCHNCGALLRDGAKFCENCGTPLQQPKTADSNPMMKSALNPAANQTVQQTGITSADWAANQTANPYERSSGGRTANTNPAAAQTANQTANQAGMTSADWAANQTANPYERSSGSRTANTNPAAAQTARPVSSVTWSSPSPEPSKKRKPAKKKSGCGGCLVFLMLFLVVSTAGIWKFGSFLKENLFAGSPAEDAIDYIQNLVDDGLALIQEFINPEDKDTQTFQKAEKPTGSETQTSQKTEKQTDTKTPSSQKAENQTDNGTQKDNTAQPTRKEERKLYQISEGNSTGSQPSPDTSASGAAWVKPTGWAGYSSNYSYSRLTPDQQTLWQRICAMADDYMDNSDLNGNYDNDYGDYQTYGVSYSDLELSIEDVDTVARWFHFANPQYWFFSNQYYLHSNRRVFFSMFDIAADGSSRAATTKQIFDKVNTWAEEIAGQPTTYLKALEAHEKICQALEYEAGKYDQSIYSTFIQGKTVCAGYSGGMTVLLNAVGIEAVSIISENHGWNAVRMDNGTWYGEDATWGDTAGDRRYFLVSSKKFEERDNEVSKESHTPLAYTIPIIPAISSENYKPSDYEQTGLTAPADLSVSRVDKDTAGVTWGSVAGASGYEIEVYQDSKLCSSASLKNPSAKITYFSEAGVTIRVRAVTTITASDGTVTGERHSAWTSCEYTHH